MNLGRNGKEQVYNSSDKLLSKAFEYFAWCEDNPWHKKELMRSGDRKGELLEVPISRPYTLAGLCVYCGISEYTFTSYKSDHKLRNAALHILEIIHQNQLEGAIIGVYNSSFVSRLLDINNVNEELVNNEKPFIIEVVNEQAKNELEKLIRNLKLG